MTDLSKLMTAIDECGVFLESARKAEAAATRARQDLEIEHGTLMRALALAQPGSEAPAPLAEPPKPETPPLDACVAAIRSTFIMPLVDGATDRMVAEQLKAKGFKFRLPTVRNAMTAIHAESRAANGVASAAAETPASEVEDLPGFLRRAKPTNQNETTEATHD